MSTKALPRAVTAPPPRPLVTSSTPDLLSIADFGPGGVRGALALAADVKAQPQAFSRSLASKQLVLIFEKPSLRTRLTFEAGMAAMGGTSFFIDSRDVRIGEREPICDVGRNLERWVDGIVLRTFAHATVSQMAEWASIPVINALTDLEHPCQALADLQTLAEHRGDLHKVKLTYVGDGNNVAHSLLLAAACVGSNIAIATPPGYEPNADVIAQAREIAATTDAEISLFTDPRDAVRGADAVYTDVWASMGQENEAAARREIFAPFQVNDALMQLAGTDALFMHCLPAHRGDEVTESVIESERSIVFDQAENRLHAQKAVLLMLLGSELRNNLDATPKRARNGAFARSSRAKN